MTSHSPEMRLISIKDVCNRTCMSRSTLWAKIKAGEFPKPVRLSEDGIRKAFVSTEVDQWISSRIEIRDRSGAAA